ncbi:MAG: cytidine deaminase, partial [Bacteroidota bacterium]|nr:cytidine deaminase [Bacteroidota bacterium]
MKKREIRLEVEEYDKVEDLDTPFNEIVFIARKASASAYSPYSHFMVGAAVLLENGEVITGSNQENSAYPSGMCAERVALFYANARYPDQSVVAIAISAQNADGLVDNPLRPCGGCAQVLLETEERFGKPVCL